MKSNTKSSITLPAAELRRVKRLKARLKLRSNVEIVRTGLRLLEESCDREALRESFRRASEATRASIREEIAELDHLTAEGLD